MARTKKVEEPKVEEVVEPLQVEKELKIVNVTEDIKTETIKPMTIIAKSSVPFRSKPNLEQKYIIGNMPVGTAYEIVKTVSSVIYGDFYALNNGNYITKDGNYSIS